MLTSRTVFEQFQSTFEVGYGKYASFNAEPVSNIAEPNSVKVITFNGLGRLEESMKKIQKFTSFKLGHKKRFTFL